MKYLVDTHAFIWAIQGSARLSSSAKSLISSTSNEIFVSAVSIYETEFLIKLKRLAELPLAPALIVEQYGFADLNINHSHMERAARLPLFHRDPWDRVLAAQSMMEGLPIISCDEALSELGADVVW